LPQQVRESVAAVARFGGGVEVTTDPVGGVRGVDAVYTDVWASMGQESESDARRVIFAPFQVNAALMAHAKPTALFMHCLPAHRGDEVTDEVIDSPASVVFDQSENRLHTQKAMLAILAAD
jgi:ornithine carbamoyltransferase